MSPLGPRHKKVDRLRRLLRRRSVRASERAFVLEGVKVVSEALDAGAPLEALYVAAGATGAVIERAVRLGVPVHELDRGVLERVADTVTPQDVLAVSADVDVPLERLSPDGGAAPSLVVVCVDVRDPGNAGTVLRSAEASGAGAVVFCDGTVDLYNPKTVRASAGSLFHVPVVAGGDPVMVLERLGAWGLRRLGTVAHGGVPYDALDLTAPVAVVLGNEAGGLPDPVLDHLDERCTIPMAGRTESLNVGMAAAVVCFEVSRQRRMANGGQP